MKSRGHKALSVMWWTLGLPVIGYLVFGFMTIFPLLGAFLGPFLLLFIYAYGVVPAFVTVCGFEFFFRDWERGAGVLATVVLGVVSTFVWLALLDFDIWNSGGGRAYYTLAVVLTGACPALILTMVEYSSDLARSADSTD